MGGKNSKEETVTRTECCLVWQSKVGPDQYTTIYSNCQELKSGKCKDGYTAVERTYTKNKRDEVLGEDIVDYADLFSGEGVYKINDNDYYQCEFSNIGKLECDKINESGIYEVRNVEEIIKCEGENILCTRLMGKEKIDYSNWKESNDTVNEEN